LSGFPHTLRPVLTSAHIAGVPVEETFLSLAPVAAASCGFVLVRLRRILWSGTGTVEL